MDTGKLIAEPEDRRQKRLAYHREWMRRYRANHPEKISEANAKHRAANREKLIASARAKYQRNRTKIIAKACDYSRKNRDKINARNRARKAADPEKARELSRASYLRCRERDKLRRRERRIELAAYMRHKRQSDPAFAIADRLRRRINGLIAKSSASKAGGLVEVSGCTLAELVIHIERQFLPGMSWANRRLWHIDHIIPCSAFDLTDESQQRVAFHFTNLRPIWAEQNHRKHGKIPDGQRRLFWSHADVGKARRLLASTAQSRPETTCTKVQ